MYDCKILADSISDHGNRLTTFEISYPYIIHAEIMTHRMFSRNTQSSRATPVLTNVKKVQDDPFIPLSFRKNVKGMADGEVMVDETLANAEFVWRQAIEAAILNAKGLASLDVHKALANRVLGPYQWFRMILTATDFDNFFALRCHPEAQAEIRTIAEMMKDQYDKHEPKLLSKDQWHMPLITGDDMPLGQLGFTDEYKERLRKISIGRCARVSYLTHDGHYRPNMDVALHDRLLENGHMSPFEHVARPFNETEWRFVDRAKDAMENLRLVRYDAAGYEYEYTSGSTHPFCQYMSHQVGYAGNLHGWWSARMDVPHQQNYALHQA